MVPARPVQGQVVAAPSCQEHQPRVACFAAPPSGRKSAAPSEPKKEAAKAKAQERAAGDLEPIPSTANGKLISKTEVAAFIQRDDMMDQMYRWALIEAGESGVRNFGLPMNVTPFYRNITAPEPLLWGFKVAIFKEGSKLTDLGIMFDQEELSKHEWVGRGDDGFPVLEGKVEQVMGKNFEIWWVQAGCMHGCSHGGMLCTPRAAACSRPHVPHMNHRKLDANPVDETLRSSIRAFCTALVTALNR